MYPMGQGTASGIQPRVFTFFFSQPPRKFVQGNHKPKDEGAVGSKTLRISPTPLLCRASHVLPPGTKAGQLKPEDTRVF